MKLMEGGGQTDWRQDFGQRESRSESAGGQRSRKTLLLLRSVNNNASKTSKESTTNNSNNSAATTPPLTASPSSIISAPLFINRLVERTIFWHFHRSVVADSPWGWKNRIIFWLRSTIPQPKSSTPSFIIRITLLLPKSRLGGSYSE